MIVISRASVIYNKPYVEQLIDSGLYLPKSLEHAALKRKAEFLAGRNCVRQCYQILGITNSVQPTYGELREPIWSGGYQGSISHCESLAIAGLTRDKGITLGVDIERWLSKEQAERIRSIVCLDIEFYFDKYFITEIEFITVVFSAKESVYKAIFRCIKRYANFSDCRVIDMSKGNLTVQLTRTLSSSMLKGRRFIVNFYPNSTYVETLAIVGMKPTYD